MMENDSDVKIFKKNNLENDADSLIQLAEDMKQQRLNGNARKASRLGKAIADLIFYPEQIDNADFLLVLRNPCINDTVLDHIKMLLTFAAESELHRELDLSSLSATAVNALYDRLISLSPEFYDRITNAFTFYYIALRKGENVAENIGRKFAMLCGDEDNETYRQIGTEIYLTVSDVIEEKIDEAGFV